MLRGDGRRGGGVLRPLSCELSSLHRADGSALWKSGGTHVLAAVFGPVAPKHARQEQSTGALVSVILKGNYHQNNYNNSILYVLEWEDLVTRWLSSAIMVQQYPRTVIQIVLQIIQADGSILAAAVHAAVAALLDAGVAMNYLPVATTFCEYHNYHDATTSSTSTTANNETASHFDKSLSRVLLLDPTAEEELEQDASTWVVLTDPRSPKQPPSKIQSSPTTDERIDDRMDEDDVHPNDGTSCLQIGSCTIRMGRSGGKTIGISRETFCQAMHVAQRTSPAVLAFWRLAVEQKIHREAQTLWSST